MPYETLNLGINLTLPTSGTQNWGQQIKATTWTRISQHQHTGSGDGQQLVTNSISNYAITTVKLSKNIGKTVASTLTPAGTTQTVDFNNGNIQKLDLGSASGNLTVTLSNGAAGSEYVLSIVQAATPREITWPASVKWANGQAPILSTTNDAIDLIYFYFDGTNYFGDWDLGYA